MISGGRPGVGRGRGSLRHANHPGLPPGGPPAPQFTERELQRLAESAYGAVR